MKKKLLYAIGAITLTTSMSANSQILDHDAASFVEIMMGNQERSLQHMANQAWERAKAEFDAFIAEENINAMDNGFSNMVVRTTQTASDLFNIERLKEMVPAISACGSSTIQALGRDSVCEEEVAEIESVSRHTARHATEGYTLSTQNEIIREVEQAHFDKCYELSGQDISNSVCSSAANLFGGASGVTKDEETQEAANYFIDLIVGVAPDTRPTIKDVENMTPEQVKSYNQRQKKEAIRSLTAASLEAINNKTRSPDVANYKPSELHRLKAYNDQRWGNESWLRQINNTALTTEEENSVNETQLLRELTSMEAYSIHLQTLQYEQTLRDEALQAAMLSLMKDRM